MSSALQPSRASVPTEPEPISNARLAAELQAVALAIHIYGLEGYARMTGQRVQETPVTEMLCPLCQEDTPSTEAFEHFGQVMCAECAASLYDPGDGWPGGETAA